MRRSERNSRLLSFSVTLLYSEIATSLFWTYNCRMLFDIHLGNSIVECMVSATCFITLTHTCSSPNALHFCILAHFVVATAISFHSSTAIGSIQQHQPLRGHKGSCPKLQTRREGRSCREGSSRTYIHTDAQVQLFFVFFHEDRAAFSNITTTREEPYYLDESWEAIRFIVMAVNP